MSKLKIQVTDEAKKSQRGKLPKLLDDMWVKIGQHHHGVNGDVVHPTEVEKSNQDLTRVITYRLGLPGLGKNDVHIEIDNDRLHISGERQEQQETTGEGYAFSEYSFGRFERSFKLPDDVNTTKAEAEMTEGVLTVTVPCHQSKGT